MAITQEQYDALNVGDYVIYAYIFNTNDKNTIPEIVRGEVGFSYGEKNVNNRVIHPDRAGKFATILSVIPKPKPEFWYARVIQYENKVWMPFVDTDGGRHYAYNEEGNDDKALWISCDSRTKRTENFDEDKVTILLK